jgi:hypothetical protein
MIRDEMQRNAIWQIALPFQVLGEELQRIAIWQIAPQFSGDDQWQVSI